ncbi:MAG: hypothetical protein WBB37_08285 [bacterium]
MNDGLKCPFKSDNEPKECDREKCVLWHEGGCAFVHLIRELAILNETLRSIQVKY